MYQVPENTPAYADLLRVSFEKHASLPCFHCKRNDAWKTWTYGDFRRGLNSAADALRKNGFRDGDKGVVIGENSPEWVVAYHAFFMAGGCTVPVDPNLPATELREIIRITEAAFIACSASLAPLFTELLPETPSVKRILVLDGGSVKSAAAWDGFCAGGDADEDVFKRRFSPRDDAVIIFTSGTTGKAKGVVLNQGNFVDIHLHAAPRMNISSDDTMLAVLPLHHVFGAGACIAAALTLGMDLVFVAAIKGPVILEAIRERQVTILPAVPKMIALFHNSIERTVKSKGPATRLVFALLRLLAWTLGPVFGKNFRKALFSSVHASFGGKLNLMISGGASLQKKYFNAFLTMGFTIVEGYGLTETFGPIHLCPGARPKLGSVGPVLEGSEIRICNPDASGAGEVLLRGISVFTHYYKNKEKTDEVFDRDGWFHTGDLGRLDKDGYLFICGRIKDVIVLESGKNAYPDELEEFYLQSELIEDIGVFGVTVNGKEIIAALIVPSGAVKEGTAPEKAVEIIYNEVVRMGRNLPSYKKLTDFRVVYDPLPRTTTQKLKKHELRAMYASRKGTPEKISPVSRSASSHDTALLANGRYAELTGQIASLFGFPRGTKILPGSLLEVDIGLDSLKRVELFCRLEERYSIVFPEETLFKVQSVGELYTLVEELRASAPGSPGHDALPTLRRRLTSATPAEAPERKRGTWLAETVPGLTFTLSKALWNVSVEGAADLPDGAPLIFCSNHQSNLDILWLMRSLPQRLRKNTFITGKSELLKSSVLAPFLTASAFIPVDREGDALKALRLSIGVLKRGKNVVIFPEGLRSRTGAMNPFKGGVGMLMLETNAAAVPVRIRGAYDIWPAGKLPKVVTGRRFNPSITFGKPLTLQKLIALGRLSPHSTADQIAASIRDIIEQM